jgi:hypothetical protein
MSHLQRAAREVSSSSQADVEDQYPTGKCICCCKPAAGIVCSTHQHAAGVACTIHQQRAALNHDCLGTGERAKNPGGSTHLHIITDAHACDFTSSNKSFKLAGWCWWMSGVMGGKSKHKATFAMQKLLSLRKAWGTGQERHACDLGHLQACMPAEGITPLAEGMAHHPVDPGAVHLLHKGTTTACDMYTDLMS